MEVLMLLGKSDTDNWWFFIFCLFHLGCLS